MRPSSGIGSVVNPQPVGESPDEKPRAVGDQTSNSCQTSLALLFGFGAAGVCTVSGIERALISRPIDWTSPATARGADFDLPEPHAVEFEQPASERSYQQPPAIFQHDGHGLSVAIGPAVMFKSFPVEGDQPL